MLHGPTRTFKQCIDIDGNIRWQPGGVDCSLAGMHPVCQMTRVESGVTVASYTSKGYSTKGLHVQKIGENGTTIWTENGLVITDDYYTSHSLSSDGMGGVIIGWGTKKGWFTEEKAFIQRVSASGKLLWGENGIRLNK